MGTWLLWWESGSSMGTWLLYSYSVRQSLEDEGLCFVLQLWPQWLAFRLTKSSLCFFFANLSSFLLSFFSSLIPRSSFFCFLPSGFVWTQILGSDTYNYLQDVLWDLMHFPSFQANSAKCFYETWCFTGRDQEKSRTTQCMNTRLTPFCYWGPAHSIDFHIIIIPRELLKCPLKTWQNPLSN